MRQRCQNPNADKFKHYGGRGIRVCDRWQSFENFFADMGHPPTPKHELDRMDNEGHYEPGNVRWATRKQQVRNTRVTKLSEALVTDLRAHVASGGRTMDWARTNGINPQTAYNVATRGAWA